MKSPCHQLRNIYLLSYDEQNSKDIIKFMPYNKKFFYAEVADTGLPRLSANKKIKFLANTVISNNTRSTPEVPKLCLPIKKLSANFISCGTLGKIMPRTCRVVGLPGLMFRAKLFYGW